MIRKVVQKLRGEKESKEVKTPLMERVEQRQKKVDERLRWLQLQAEALRRGKA